MTRGVLMQLAHCTAENAIMHVLFAMDQMKLIV